MPASRAASSSLGESPARPRAQFATTRWSIVLRAASPQTPQAHAALTRLCQTYWYPLYGHARRRGYNGHDAQDLTQGFFAHLLAGDLLARANPARGRFRSLVLSAFNHFLHDEHARAQAQKRGGGVVSFSIDADAAERRFGAEPADERAPDKAFDRQWALVLLSEVVAQLEREYREADKSRAFALLKQTLTGGRESQPYAQLAAQLGLSEGAVKVAVHRLRRRYRELLEAEIAHTVAAREDAAAELRHLFQALADGGVEG